MERETGIEPAPSAWKAEVLPLNYSRAGNCMPQRETGGGRWIRTTEGVSQQIYSLPPLAAWVSLQLLLPDRCAMRRIRFGVKQPVILLWDACSVNKNFEQIVSTEDARPSGSRATGQTLKRKCSTSPSCTRYSLPSRRKRPASRAPASPRCLMKSSKPIVSARMKPFSKSVWITAAACGAVEPALTVHARTSLTPAVK